MTSTELATTTKGALALDDAGWSDEQVAALVQLGVEHASKADLQVYHHVCLRTGLDPFARQIYMIQREGKQTIQTGIDGFRLVARRAINKSGEAFSIGAPEWCGPDGVWREVWLEDGPPAAARVTIHRASGTFVGIALWREYVGLKRDGSITRMWATRGAGQLAKCAEALGLRKAFPQDLSGLYTEDEVAGSAVGVEQREARNTLKDVLASDDTIDGEVVEPPDLQHLPRLWEALDALGIDPADRREWIANQLGRPIDGPEEITPEDVEQILAAIEGKS